MIPSELREMTISQKKCAILFCRLMGGWHHVPKMHKFGRGIAANFSTNTFSTYDLNVLTRLVLLCHKYYIRAELHQSGPRMVKISLHKRRRKGDIYQRHPGLDQLIKSAKTLKKRWY